MDTATTSRITIARERAAAAKQALAIGAIAIFGFLILFFRGGQSPATASTDNEGTQASSSDSGVDDSLGGGTIAPSSQSSGFPQAHTGVS